MRRVTAALGSLAFFVVAPGLVAGVIPWWFTHWEVGRSQIALPLRLAGVALITAGVAVLVSAFARFVAEGRGTPAPIAPTDRLVIGGLYRYVRNPMYLAVLGIIVGQALALSRLELLAYGAAAGITMGSFVRFYEEPVLMDRYGAQCSRYRRAVPGWWPRLHAWQNNPAIANDEIEPPRP